MKVFTMDDLSYRGAHKGVHSWDHPASTTPYYWHPDWLHIAEDALGVHKTADLSFQKVKHRQKSTQKRRLLSTLMVNSQKRTFCYARLRAFWNKTCLNENCASS